VGILNSFSLASAPWQATSSTVDEASSFDVFLPR
jgi:hypothetical protein